MVKVKSYLGHDFLGKVKNFEPQFLSPQKSKLKNFSAHQKEFFFMGVMPSQNMGAFFLEHPVDLGGSCQSQSPSIYENEK